MFILLGLWHIISVAAGFPDGSVVKNLPTKQETRVWSLGQEDPMGVGNGNLLQKKSPWTHEHGGLQSIWFQRAGHDLETKQLQQYLCHQVLGFIFYFSLNSLLNNFNSTHSYFNVYFPSGSVGKESACNQETQVQSQSQEDPLEKEMATHSSTLAWRIPWTEDRDRLQSMELQSETRLCDFHFFFICIFI